MSQPVVLFEPEPQFSEEARKAKVAGNVLVSMVVGIDGHTSNIKVLRGIGLGLDEKAREGRGSVQVQTCHGKRQSSPRSHQS